MVCSPKTGPAGLLVSWNAKERRADHEEVPVLAGADRLRLAAGGDWLSAPTAFGRYTTLVTRQSGEPSSTVPKPLRDLTDRNRPSFTSAIAFVGDEPAEFWSLIATYDWYLVTRLLFGGLDRLPSNWPFECWDLYQWEWRLGFPASPPFEGREHHALDDARWARRIYESLASIEEGKPEPLIP
jgi:hypothetical protein